LPLACAGVLDPPRLADAAVLDAEDVDLVDAFSPSAIRSTISISASGKLSRNGAIQRRAPRAISAV
jgi:hypothetical protein